MDRRCVWHRLFNRCLGFRRLLDYTGLTLNDETANIELTNMQIAVLGEVAVNATVR